MHFGIVDHTKNSNYAIGMLSHNTSIRLLLKVDFDNGLIFILRISKFNMSNPKRINSFYKKLNNFFDEKYDFKIGFSFQKFYKEITKFHIKHKNDIPCTITDNFTYPLSIINRCNKGYDLSNQAFVLCK